eukprot:350155-Chlamydomonas_euryale.AAC.2
MAWCGDGCRGNMILLCHTRVKCGADGWGLMCECVCVCVWGGNVASCGIAERGQEGLSWRCMHTLAGDPAGPAAAAFVVFTAVVLLASCCRCCRGFCF